MANGRETLRRFRVCQDARETQACAEIAREFVSIPELDRMQITKIRMEKYALVGDTRNPRRGMRLKFAKGDRGRVTAATEKNANEMRIFENV